jgi:hypothetical protein
MVFRSLIAEKAKQLRIRKLRKRAAQQAGWNQ